MSVGEKYVAVFCLLVLAPAAYFYLPATAALPLSMALFLPYILFIVSKPKRRCVPCGEIITLGPRSYMSARNGSLKCPKCSSSVKNKHRI